MILTDVLTACDLNPNYYKFIPIFIKAWKNLFHDINIHIILISSNLIDELKPYSEHIKLFPPLKGISTAFIAQTIRLLYPAVLDKAKGGIIITDMDMVPMGRKYYTEQIKDFDSTKFICYRPLDCVGENEMVICYNIAHSNVWGDVFNIKTKNDIVKVLQTIYFNNNDYENIHGGKGWCLDQLYLYRATQDWNKRTNSLIILNEKMIEHVKDLTTKTNLYTRISNWNVNEIQILKNVEKNLLVDFHIPKNYDLDSANQVINSLI